MIRVKDDLAEGFDWWMFHCACCGEETFVGRSLGQSVVEFTQMCEWLYGDPPVCTRCLHPERF